MNVRSSFFSGLGYSAGGTATTAAALGALWFAKELINKLHTEDMQKSGFLTFVGGAAVLIDVACAGVLLYGSYRFFRAAGTSFKEACQTNAPVTEDLHTHLATPV